MFRAKSAAALYAALFVLAVAPAAQADSVDDRFQRAFFLEEHKHDLAAAEKLYAEVAGDKSADAKTRKEAAARRDGCREELACRDFTRLMPGNAWAYAELSQPGEQVVTLLGQLGLLRDASEASGKLSQQIAISPELVRELIGIRGVAAAITGFDASTQVPSGVAVLHPGRLDVIRALMETALPIQFTPSEPIEGFSTYEIERQVLVTITSRLIIVSPQRDLIEGVIDRIRGDVSDSLAESAEMAETLKDRGQSLLYFSVNFKPIMPLLRAGLAAGSTQSRELAMATSLLDPGSLRTLSGRVGFGEDGFTLKLDLMLDSGHRNLAFDFLRLPTVDSEALRRVPAGVAGFITASLGEARSRHPQRGEAAKQDNDERPAVTFLDIGREIFANIVGVTAFVLPSTESAGGSTPPLPDAALLLTVNDPSKSEALWGLFLGIASMASGGGSIDGSPIDIEGAKARRYTLPDGVTIYFATSGNAVLISPSRNAIGRAVATQRGGQSVSDDPVFSPAMAQITADSTLALFAHPGRCIELAKSYMDSDDLREVQPFLEPLKTTVAGMVLSHGDHALGVSVRVTGLPRIGHVVSKLIGEQLRGGASLARKAHSRDPMQSLAAIEQRLANAPDDARMLREKFDIVATQLQRLDAANEVGEQLMNALGDDATKLNSFAWSLVTEDRYAKHFASLAERCSRKSNELTDWKNWMFIDTLAHARFALGDVTGAIQLEEKALKLVGESGRRSEVEKALLRFTSALSRAPDRTSPTP